MPKFHFFVTTALQYLNAVEANFSFNKNSDESILYVFVKNESRRKELIRTVDTDIWTRILYIDNVNYISSRTDKILSILKFRFRKKKMDHIASTINSADFLFIGNINENIFKYLVLNIIANVYLLDDGFATLNTIKKSKKQLLTTNGFSQLLEELLLNVNRFDLLDYKFFTSLNLGPDITFILHSFENVKRRLNRHIKTINYKVIYFLGQPLINRNMLNRSQYIEAVNSIQNYYNQLGYEFVYLSHPAERNDNIIEHWNVKKNCSPIELYIIESNNIPKTFGTFFSSSCFNLSKILPEEKHKFDYWKLDQYEESIVNNNIVYKYLVQNPVLNIEIFSFAKKINEYS